MINFVVQMATPPNRHPADRAGRTARATAPQRSSQATKRGPGTVPPAPPRRVPPGGGRRERMALPFDPRRRRTDAGEWVYRHRVGLLVTVVLYLIAAILFVSYKIIVLENPTTTMYIDLVDPNEPEEPKPELEEPKPEPIRRLEANYEPVSNRISDQNAKMDASLRDDRGTRVDQLMEEAERVQRELEAGQQAFRSGMDELAEMSKRSRMPKSSSSQVKLEGGSERKTVKVQGNVTVSYNLAGRYATYLHVPAYQCREGGTVVVGITVNREGEVTSAAVEQASPGDCIAERAVQAARASRFNADASAADRQRGTITYVFVAQ